MNHKELLSVLGRRIRELRTSRGWTQEDLARRARVTADFLGKAERGDKEPSLFVLLKLATVFGVGPAYFLTPPVHAGSDLDEIASLLGSRSGYELAWIKQFILFVTENPVARASARVAEPHLPLKYGHHADGRARRTRPQRS